MCDVMPTILEEGGGDAEMVACCETGSYSGSVESLDGAYSLDRPEFNNPFLVYAKLDGDGGARAGEVSETSLLPDNSSSASHDAHTVAACTPPTPSPHSGRNLEQLMLSMLEERDRLLETLRDTQEKLTLLQHRLADAEKERDLLQKQFETSVPQVRTLSHSRLSSSKSPSTSMHSWCLALSPQLADIYWKNLTMCQVYLS